MNVLTLVYSGVTSRPGAKGGGGERAGCGVLMVPWQLHRPVVSPEYARRTGTRFICCWMPVSANERIFGHDLSS